MMRRRYLGALALALAALATGSGCTTESASPVASSSIVPEDIPDCSEIYKEGAIVEDRSFGVACVRGEQLLTPIPVRIECVDGRQLRYNDLAWGYVSEPMTLTPEDDPSKAPEEAVDECIAPNPGGPPASDS
jgi:hypothetical protein